MRLVVVSGIPVLRVWFMRIDRTGCPARLLWWSHVSLHTKPNSLN